MEHKLTKQLIKQRFLNNFKGSNHQQKNSIAITIGSLLKFKGAKFINKSYQKILGRPPDVDGFSNNLLYLLNGSSKEAVLYSIITSNEAKQRNLVFKDYWRLSNIKFHYFKFKMLKMLLKFPLFSLFKKVARIPYHFINLSDRLIDLTANVNKVSNQMNVNYEKNRLRLQQMEADEKNLKLQIETLVKSLQVHTIKEKSILENVNKLIDSRLTKELHKKDTVSIQNVLSTNGYINSNSYVSEALKQIDLPLKKIKSYAGSGFYYLFENLFRGSIKDISQRQKIYLPYIKQIISKVKNNSYFLDFGCGRGEFLTLLKQNNINAKGVEINKIYAELNIKNNLEVYHQDGLDFLAKIPDNHLTGLSAFQVIGHIDQSKLELLIKLSYEKIVHQGIIIIETINPYCQRSMRNFYLDPSHLRPYPADTLKLMYEWYGFKNIKIVYSSPVIKKYQTEDIVSNYMDYAIVGYKK